MGRFRLVALVGLAVVALAGGACSSSDSEVSSGSTTPPGTGTTIPVGGSMMTTTPAAQVVTADTLADQTFVSTSVTGYELATGTQVTLSFTATDLSASAGCNTLGGAYTLEGGRLVVSGDLRSTMMACPDPVMAQDTWLSELLGSDPAIAATGTGIALTSGDVTIELAPEGSTTTGASGPADPAALVGPTWTVHSFVMGDAVSSVASTADAPTFTFAADGTVEVFTGCNRGSTTYTATFDGQLTFAPMPMTLMACEDQNAQVTEVAVTTLLNEKATFAFDGGDLVLTGLEGSLVASAS